MVDAREPEDRQTSWNARTAIGIAGALALLLVVLLLFREGQAPPTSGVQADPERLRALKQQLCTVENERQFETVVTRVEDGRADVRASAWMAGGDIRRGVIAGWISVCRADGEPISIFADETGQLIGTYARERGYLPALVQ